MIVRAVAAWASSGGNTGSSRLSTDHVKKQRVNKRNKKKRAVQVPVHALVSYTDRFFVLQASSSKKPKGKRRKRTVKTPSLCYLISQQAKRQVSRPCALVIGSPGDIERKTRYTAKARPGYEEQGASTEVFRAVLQDCALVSTRVFTERLNMRVIDTLVGQKIFREPTLLKIRELFSSSDRGRRPPQSFVLYYSGHGSDTEQRFHLALQMHTPMLVTTVPPSQRVRCIVSLFLLMTLQTTSARQPIGSLSRRINRAP